MDLMNMPVTLVVKAPNQRIEDQTVECMLGWTVKKLKAHLSQVYPNQPKENHQRLIYSGKLLHDSLVLKDVLRKYDDNPTHTVHLVCAHGADGGVQKTQSVSSPSTTGSAQSHSAAQPHTAPFGSDGLRHRQTHITNPQIAFQQFYAANAQMMAAMPPGGMMQYSPQQMMWMQHMYAQQMAHYMQHYHQTMAQQQQHTVQNNQIPGVVPANNQQILNQPRPANQPEQVRMNAQGGAVMDDEEDEMGNRDWLDWIYTLCRVGVLLSIVYFYSSLSRFFMVFGLFIMMYLYQTGFFRIRRRQNEIRPNQLNAQDANGQEADHENQQNNNQNQAADENSGDNDTEQEQPQVPAGPPRPSALVIAWSFFITFFTSLIPQQPGAVNAN